MLAGGQLHSQRSKPRFALPLVKSFPKPCLGVMPSSLIKAWAIKERRERGGGKLVCQQDHQMFHSRKPAGIRSALQSGKAVRHLLRCILPELTVVQESHTQPLSTASQFPHKSPAGASSGDSKNSFGSKNIHPSFLSLMLRIPPLYISVFILKSQVHKPEAWEPALQVWWVKYLFLMHKIWLIIPFFRSLWTLDEMLVASELRTYTHYPGGSLKVLIIRFPPHDSVDSFFCKCTDV